MAIVQPQLAQIKAMASLVGSSAAEKTVSTVSTAVKALAIGLFDNMNDMLDLFFEAPLGSGKQENFIKPLLQHISQLKTQLDIKQLKDVENFVHLTKFIRKIMETINKKLR